MENAFLEPVTVYNSRTQEACLEHSYVLQLAGVECLILEEDGRFAIVVEAVDRDRAERELDRYTRENRGPAIEPAPIEPTFKAWGGALSYAAVLIVVDLLQRSRAFSFDWREAGRTQAALIRDGEWWRTITALTLHLDVLHLVGNLIFGVLFGWLASRRFGAGVAWCSIVVAGAMGNALNAFIQSPNHSSLGASTAVFAGLGLLAAHTWSRKQRQRQNRMQRWAPIVAAAVLLSLLGTGGERTDVVAHVTGFASGAILGALFGMLGSRSEYKAGRQVILGLGTFAALVSAWILALPAHG